jgi:hypothetical protein
MAFIAITVLEEMIISVAPTGASRGWSRQSTPDEELDG